MCTTKLIEQALAGNAAAKSALAQELSPVVRGLARKCFQRLPHTSAEDIENELWLHVFKDQSLLSQALNASQPEHYLKRSLRFKCIDITRKLSTERKYRCGNVYPQCGETLPNDPDSILEILNYRDGIREKPSAQLALRARLFAQAAKKLEPMERHVLKLLLDNDLPVEVQARQCRLPSVAALYKSRFKVKRKLSHMVTTMSGELMSADPVCHAIALKMAL